MKANLRRALLCLLGPGAALAALSLLFALAASASAASASAAAASAAAASAAAAGGPATPPPQLFPLPAPAAGVNAPLGPQASQIDFRKTVGTNLNLTVCAATKVITVTAGTVVAYCFQTYNTGTITLTRHAANDSQFGVLLPPNTVFTLTPLNGVQLVITRTIASTVVNTATWTAYNPGPTDQTSDTDSAKVAVLSFVYLPVVQK